LCSRRSCRIAQRVTLRRGWLFEPVFVFAVTQISHTCERHLPPLGTGAQPCCLLRVWWVWVYTSWVTNWLIPT